MSTPKQPTRNGALILAAWILVIGGIMTMVGIIGACALMSGAVAAFIATFVLGGILLAYAIAFLSTLDSQASKRSSATPVKPPTDNIP